MRTNTHLHALGIVLAAAGISTALMIFGCSPERVHETIHRYVNASLRAGETIHITVRANATAIGEADLGFWLSVQADERHDEIVLIPDIAALDERVRPEPGRVSYVTMDLDDITELCPEAGEDCEFGLTIESTNDTSLLVTALLLRKLESGPFTSDATMSIEID
jgi:hypothetical protein